MSGPLRAEERLFAEASARTEVERIPLLEHACKGDAVLRERILTLLAHDSSACLSSEPAEGVCASRRVTRRDVLRLLGSLWVGIGLNRPESLAQTGTREILIRGGLVVNATDTCVADVRIIGETIAEVGGGLSPSPGARIVEAAGRIIVPGGIDPHTHLGGAWIDDFTSGSMAALAGGITTVGAFANTRGEGNVPAALERVVAVVRSQAIADVFLHGQAWPPQPESMAQIAALGHPSFKVFLARNNFEPYLDPLLRALEAARTFGVVTLFHCEDWGLIEQATRKLEASGRTSLAAYAESRPVAAEAFATARAISFCERTRAPTYIVHLSSSAALSACRSARKSGLPVYVETRPLYLHLTEERLQGPDGPLFVGMPPLRTPADSAALWSGLANGDIDVLATDHAPWLRAQKLDPAASTIRQFRAGVCDLPYMLPMYFSEGTGKRGLPLERFVATTSTNAARIFGLYPRKGVIREGSDADVVIWDPKLERKVAASRGYSKSDYTVYEGWPVTGWPILTIRRGEIAFDGERILASAGSGRVLARSPWRPE
jgi:dihydropyrimidinase